MMLYCIYCDCFKQRPLFLIANDLEIDFPSNHAIALLTGEEAQLSNCYIQGSLNGSGLYIGPGQCDVIEYGAVIESAYGAVLEWIKVVRRSRSL